MSGVSVPIVTEAEDWLLVCKPAQLLVHPTKPGGPVTLFDLLRGLLAYELVNGGQVSLVHRLDRETSGLLLVAKTAAAARHFGLAMMRGDSFHKEYLAVVHGWPEWDAHVMDAPLLRAGSVGPSAVWLRQTLHPDGAPARTKFTVERRFTRGPDGGGERFALLRAVPATGRLHQIRVHAAALGHPLVGDKIYGPDPGLYLEFIGTGWTPALERVLLLPRHALHATVLGFLDPHGVRQRGEAPLPADLRGFLENGPAGTKP